jgi:hypothetical protein
VERESSRVRYEAYEFLDMLEIGKHVLFFYEKLDYALMIEFRFLRNALSKGEQCIFAVNGDSAMLENQMAYTGIDVEECRKRDLLRILYPPNVMDDPEGPEKGAEKIVKEIMAETKTPFWVIASLIPSINTREQMDAALNIEHNLHASFSERKYTWLCPYSTDDINAEIRDEFMNGLMMRHHAVISASKSGMGMAFNI